MTEKSTLALHQVMCIIIILTPLARALGTPGSSCQSDMEELHCSSSTTGLICVLYKCTCPAGLVWDSTTSKCVDQSGGQVCDGAGGTTCSNFFVCTGQTCVCQDGAINEAGKCKATLNSPCDPNEVILPNCASGLVCGTTSNICECATGNDDCRSGAGLGDECSDTILCDNALFLSCENNKCECMGCFHDNGKGVCKVDLHCPCNASDQCDLFADCNPISNMCNCKHNYEELANKCRKRWGASCTTNEECAEDLYLRCSGVQKVCVCTLGFLYDSPKDSCKVQNGGGCSEDDQCRSGNCGDDDEICKAPAKGQLGQVCGDKLPCDHSRSLTCGPLNRCQCTTGEEPNFDGLCGQNFICPAAGLFFEPTNPKLFHTCLVGQDGELIDTIMTCPEGTVWQQDDAECRNVN